VTAGITDVEALKAETGLDTVAPRARLLSVSQIVRRLFRMALLFLAARLLGVETFGQYALLLTVVEMIALLSGLGYVDFLTREVAKRPGVAWSLGARITILRLAYTVPGLGLAVLALTALRFPAPVVLNTALMAITLVPRAAGESAQGVLRGLRRFAPLPWIELVQGAIVLAAAGLLLHLGFGLRGMIAAEVLSAIGGAAVALASGVRTESNAAEDAPGFRDLVRSTFAFNVYPFIVNVYDRVDVVLLAKLVGSVATGIYALPYRAYGTLCIIPYGVMGALLPAFSASRVDQNSREACARAMMFLYLVALLIVLATLTFAGPIVSQLLGESYAGSIQTIKILIWACVPAFMNFALSTLLLAAHREKVFLWTALIGTVFNVTANLLLIPRYSFLAAAAVTVATESLLLCMNLYLVKRLLGQAVFPKKGIRISLGFVVVITAYWLLGRQIPQIWAGSAACLVFALLAARTTSGMRVIKALVSRSGAR
jgi:O-antigen/teichoic acid export membrane protein